MVAIKQFRQLSLSLLILLSNPGLCVDLGSHNPTHWGISEPDIRETFVKDASQVDWGKVEQDLEDQSEKWASSLPDFGYTKTKKTKTHWIDPSIVVDEDIWAPQPQEDGSWKWELVIKAGTRSNPLETMVMRPPDMLFFSTSDEEQVALAKMVAKEHPYNIMLVDTAGNPKDLSNKIGIPVYYTNEKLSEKFKIEKVPSLVGVGANENKYLIAVTELAPPFTLDKINRYWYGDPNQ